MPENRHANIYKVATIVLSAAMVVLTFVSVVYYRRLDDRSRRVQNLDDRIKAFQSRLDVVNRVPKVAVRVKTVKGSGLPESAFSGISAVPSVLQIDHQGGDTARGITVRLTVDAIVLRVSLDHCCPN